MAVLTRQHWPPALGRGLPRRDREGCEYYAYLPDPLHARAIVLKGDVAADVADAETAIVRLNGEAPTLTNTEALARLLLRAEAVASSRIEGLQLGARRLLRAEAAGELGERVEDVTAEEVLGNISAMHWAIAELARAPRIEAGDILAVHRRLLQGTPQAARAGKVREVQNWIGGSSFNPCRASFVPPPPEAVPALLDDLASFCNEDSLPPVVQAAIAHAQFETIHPFTDGNGRTGRILIHVILRRRGLVRDTLPPVSLVLATLSDDYVLGLEGTRYLGDPGSREAADGVNRWLAFFAASCLRAVDDVRLYEDRVSRLHEQWLQALGKSRRGSAAALLLAALPATPVLTVNSAARLIGRSFQSTNEAIDRLVAAGVLQPIVLGRRRNRAFEAGAAVDLFTDLERQLASRSADTLVSPPARPAPQRRP